MHHRAGIFAQSSRTRATLTWHWRIRRVDWRVVLVNIKTASSTLRRKDEGGRMAGTELRETKESFHSVTFPAKAFAARSATSGLGPFTIQRRTPRAQDVQIDVLYCGICHSDLHQVRDEWNTFVPTVYPCVPGHEIVGRVVKVGSAVHKFKEGDIAAVGCMVDSCRKCPSCLAGEEQYCEE